MCESQAYTEKGKNEYQTAGLFLCHLIRAVHTKKYNAVIENIAQSGSKLKLHICKGSHRIESAAFITAEKLWQLYTQKAQHIDAACLELLPDLVEHLLLRPDRAAVFLVIAVIHQLVHVDLGEAPAAFLVKSDINAVGGEACGLLTQPPVFDFFPSAADAAEADDHAQYKHRPHQPGAQTLFLPAAQKQQPDKERDEPYRRQRTEHVHPEQHHTGEKPDNGFRHEPQCRTATLGKCIGKAQREKESEDRAGVYGFRENHCVVQQF